MGQNLSALSFNIANEWALTLTINNQTVGELGLLDSVSRKVNCTLVEVKPVNNNGRPVRRTTFEGFTFSYSYTRQDDTFDDIVDALIAAYEAQAGTATFSGFETMVSVGTASMWLYSGGIMVPGGLGDPKGTDKIDGVTFDIHWDARSKIRGASSAPTVSIGAGL